MEKQFFATFAASKMVGAIGVVLLAAMAGCTGSGGDVAPAGGSNTTSAVCC